MFDGAITDIPGIRVGQVTDREHATGCTVVLSTNGAVGGVGVRGAAPGTRETDLLRPGNAVERIHGVVLAGGSAFGLDAAGGVMRWCEQQDIGLETPYAKVPIIPGAVLYDLGVGSSVVRPDSQMGYDACLVADDTPPRQGRVGAGTGATVGKAFGNACAMAGGVGTASVLLPSGVWVGAIVAVNALGDIVNPETGEMLAGARDERGTWLHTADRMLEQPMTAELLGQNTTIGVIATDALLDKAQCGRLAETGHDGLALAVRPVHTMLDGDTLFALSYGDKREDFNVVMAAAVKAVYRAICNAVGG